jgi:hypothetical protein
VEEEAPRSDPAHAPDVQRVRVADVPAHTVMVMLTNT